MNTILIAVILLTATGIICSVLLALAAKFFAVKEDERAAAIRECLPGANCGSCGFSGCDGYAKALSEGKTDKCNLCIPGADSVAKQVADIMGQEAQDVVEQVAYVACNGLCKPETKKYKYEGIKTCHAANMMYNGDRVCTSACLGYGDCISVCPQHAISIGERGVAVVDVQKCIGCGICTRTCPNHIIHLVPDVSEILVKCSNHDKGAAVRKACVDGCIACGKCERTCKNDAIHVVDGLPVVDYEKCVACGECVAACPCGVIKKENLMCGAHLS